MVPLLFTRRLSSSNSVQVFPSRRKGRSHPPHHLLNPALWHTPSLCLECPCPFHFWVCPTHPFRPIQYCPPEASLPRGLGLCRPLSGGHPRHGAPSFASAFLCCPVLIWPVSVTSARSRAPGGSGLSPRFLMPSVRVCPVTLQTPPAWATPPFIHAVAGTHQGGLCVSPIRLRDTALARRP